MKKLLVPVDFSAGARAALRQAGLLAKPFKASIEVLHVWEPTPYIHASDAPWLAHAPDGFWQHVQADLEAQLKALVEDEIPDWADTISYDVHAGYVSQTILERLNSGDFDMVVMGTRGRTGLSHLLLGSVAERIVRLSPVPVVTLHAPQAEDPAAEG